MEPFLRQVARLLLADHGNALADVAIVLPSQRAGLYLRHHLAELAGGALWSPQLITLTGMAERISGLAVAGGIDLLFEAFLAYRAIDGHGTATLGEFMQWGPTAVRDMSEVDAHLVPLDRFYRDLRNWEELDWSFNADDRPMSPGQQRMLRYWTMKGELHRELNARLLARGAGTAGAVERVASGMADTTAQRTGWTKVWAVGLNALAPAQLAILRTLQASGMLEVAWDADRYYLDDRDQEAGDPLRASIEALGAGRIPPSNDLLEAERVIDVVTVPNNVAQAQFAASELAALPAEKAARTAVVLADEQLLMPLLDVLPPDIGPVNVTMGLPLGALPVGSLLDAVIALHRDHRAGMGYRVSDVDRLLRHPLLLRGEGTSALRNALDTLRNTRRTRVMPDALEDLLSRLAGSARQRAASLLLEPATTGSQLGSRLLAAIAWASENAPEDTLAQEQLFLAARVEQRIHALCRRHAIATDVTTHALVHQRALQEERLGLFGEPLAGVQVMGALETRVLDLERLIVLSVQEGVIPPTSTDRSFIPFEVRRAHGLPLRQVHDAVSAYHFLRSLQRSAHVTLVRSGGEGSQGPSRFVLQLSRELAPRSHTRYGERVLQAPVPARPAATVVVEKDEVVLEGLRAYLRKGLAPTALGLWLRCPLNFHFLKVLRLKEVEEAADMIAPEVLGSAIHLALEQAYRPFIGRELDTGMLEGISRVLPGHLRALLEKELGRDALDQGQPLLQYAMAEQAMLAFVAAERERVAGGGKVELVELEKDLGVPLPHAKEAHGIEVNLSGRVDRIERREGVLTILDVKTGHVQKDQLKLRSLDADALRPDKDGYALQLLLYAYTYLLQHPEVPALRAGLVPLQRASESAGIFLEVEGTELITREMMPRVEALVHRCIERMLDPGVPIKHRPESTYCRFCAG